MGVWGGRAKISARCGRVSRCRISAADLSRDAVVKTNVATESDSNTPRAGWSVREYNIQLLCI